MIDDSVSSGKLEFSERRVKKYNLRKGQEENGKKIVSRVDRINFHCSSRSRCIWLREKQMVKEETTGKPAMEAKKEEAKPQASQALEKPKEATMTAPAIKPKEETMPKEAVAKPAENPLTLPVQGFTSLSMIIAFPAHREKG